MNIDAYIYVCVCVYVCTHRYNQYAKRIIYYNQLRFIPAEFGSTFEKQYNQGQSKVFIPMTLVQHSTRRSNQALGKKKK